MTEAIYSVRLKAPIDREALTLVATVAVEMVRINELASGHNGGDDSMEWEDIDRLHGLAGPALEALERIGASVYSTRNPDRLSKDADETVLEVEGIAFSRRSLGFAAAACRALLSAYRAGERSGGSMEWDDVDRVIERAVKAVGDAGLAKLVQEALVENGCEDDEPESTAPRARC